MIGQGLFYFKFLVCPPKQHKHVKITNYLESDVMFKGIGAWNLFLIKVIQHTHTYIGIIKAVFFIVKHLVYYFKKILPLHTDDIGQKKYIWISLFKFTNNKDDYLYKLHSMYHKIPWKYLYLWVSILVVREKGCL